MGVFFDVASENCYTENVINNYFCMDRIRPQTLPSEPAALSQASSSALARQATRYKILSGLLAVLLVVASSSAAYFYYKFSNIQKTATGNSAQDEVKVLVERVSKLVVLPEGETPTVATVTEPDRLKDQPFFTNAKKGFKVLIFTNAKKAILYDPEADKVVEVAPVNLGNVLGTGTQTPSK
jgi:hypothetical protein